tara:strand:+ start:439 stop:738 length:300 start_codon:yes stop_codon:yes gene_type:complete
MLKLITSIFAVSSAVLMGLPQIYKIYKTKKTNDLSAPYLFLWTVCSISWVGYGYLDNDIPLIVCDSIILVQNIYLMWAKIYYDKLLCYKPTPTASIEDL